MYITGTKELTGINRIRTYWNYFHCNREINLYWQKHKKQVKPWPMWLLKCLFFYWQDWWKIWQGFQRYDHIRTVGLKLAHGSKLPGSLLNTDNFVLVIPGWGVIICISNKVALRRLIISQRVWSLNHIRWVSPRDLLDRIMPAVNNTMLYT